MDAFLTTDALRTLQAVALLSGSARPAGVLLGHVRGGRFLVEAIVAGQNAKTSSLEVQARLDDLDPGRVIGFFVFSPTAAGRRAFAKPHACGKLFLAVKKGRSGGLGFKGYHIDYDGRFVFLPVAVNREGKLKK